MQRHGWNILCHPCLVLQLQKPKTAAERAELAAPPSFTANTVNREPANLPLRHPIFNPQALNPFKLAHIVGHQGSILRQRMAGNP